MKLTEFLIAKRAASKFQTLVDVSAYSKTRGWDMSAESLRLIEKGDRIPNSDTRSILIEIYKMNDDEINILNRLCALEIVKRDFPSQSLSVVDIRGLKDVCVSIENCLKHDIPDSEKSRLLKDLSWIKAQLT